MRATTEQFLAHLLRPTTRYRPDIQALRVASTRIVVAGGTTSKGQLATVPPWHWPTSSVRAWSTSPVTTADSWPSRSSAAASWTRCSPKRPEPAETLQGSAAGRASRTTSCCTSSGRGGRPVEVEG